MRRLISLAAAAAMTGGLVIGAAAPASADPIITTGCQPGDKHVVVEVLNTEVAEVCYS